jgi:hypothetical protein
MSWVKIDDKFTEHPKLISVSPLGIALQVAALCYANTHLTDGFIPYNVVQKLISFRFSPPGDNIIYTISVTSGMQGEDVDCDMISNWLVDAGVWEAVDGGFYIHDYPVYQPLKNDVLGIHDERSKAGKQGGIKSGDTRRSKSEAKSKQSTKQNQSKLEANDIAKSNPVPVPVPLKELKDCEIEKPISRADLPEIPELIPEKKKKNSPKEQKLKLLPSDPDYWKFLKENEPIGKIFYQSSNLFPVGNEFGLWVKGCAALKEAGVTPEIIPKAVIYMREQNLSIKSPGSILTVAREIMNKNSRSEDLGWNML